MLFVRVHVRLLCLACYSPSVAMIALLVTTLSRSNLITSCQNWILALQIAAAVALSSYFKANVQNGSILACMVCGLHYGHDCGLNEGCKGFIILQTFVSPVNPPCNDARAGWLPERICTRRQCKFCRSWVICPISCHHTVQRNIFV